MKEEEDGEGGGREMRQENMRGRENIKLCISGAYNIEGEIGKNMRQER